MAERVIDVAGHIIKRYCERSGESGIDEMKLHKLLYLCQRESYAITGKPMFAEALEGWRYGPVSREVRVAFMPDGLSEPTESISDESAYIVNNVIEQYAQYDTWKLSEITHKETSWIRSRKGLTPSDPGHKKLEEADIMEDAKKIRPYDSLYDMYYDEFDDAESVMA